MSKHRGIAVIYLVYIYQEGKGRCNIQNQNMVCEHRGILLWVCMYVAVSYHSVGGGGYPHFR